MKMHNHRTLDDLLRIFLATSKMLEFADHRCQIPWGPIIALVTLW